MKVFLIEDDMSIFRLIEERLQQWSLQITGPKDFQKVMNDFTEVNPQLVIIDIQLPAYDGFHWCREIRTVSNVPILFLSSRDHPMDMVMAMQLGADDFIQKPFHMDVLVAKIQALLRRTYDYQQQVQQVVSWQEAIIDYERGLLMYHDRQIDFTKNELFILKLLVERVDRIVTREELMRKLWDDERFVNDNTLTVNINRLRQKLGEVGLANVIITKKGIGYMAVSK